MAETASRPGSTKEQKEMLLICRGRNQADDRDDDDHDYMSDVTTTVFSLRQSECAL